MSSRSKTGGRKVGTPNKRNSDVEERLRKLGCDPVAGMAAIAMDETQDIALRASMYKELAQYVASKRKAVELSGQDGASFSLVALVQESFKQG